jgi:hypothetical protein
MIFVTLQPAIAVPLESSASQFAYSSVAEKAVIRPRDVSFRYAGCARARTRSG